jgi:hypothetical protein
MLLDRDAIFALWAPAASPWSVWAKPLLFAHLREARLRSPESLRISPSWVPAADGTTLIVADLPGALSVRICEILAVAGFRPVPLFNAVPGPIVGFDESLRIDSVVDVHAIIEALHAATEEIGDVLRALPAEAPPVFLLDSTRRTGRIPRSGDFDNRSVSLPTDFPSATFLMARGIARVVLLVADRSGAPAADLSHTLLRWQEAGIRIYRIVLEDALRGSELEPIRVRKPKWFRAIWHHALAIMGLRRNPLGGYGGTLTHPSSG